MLEKKYFAYIRVSTVRQGQTGTSLIEQRSAIERYSSRWNLKIVKEFEEQETAAKRGRPVFLEMIKALKKGKASGVVMHKIDRSARNLRDWAELGELIDKGIEVHFANENLDLYSRGGRLSADIQAVVAADYIRNLRDEVKKGLYGRLKQGFYPMPAPIGYLDRGAAKPKSIDPILGPLVRKAFELYATGEYGLRGLTETMGKQGLKTRSGNPISVNGLTKMLHNPFYTGVIQMKATGELYQGKHLPLISRTLFDRVQDVSAGKTVHQTNKTVLNEIFLFRKLLTCDLCKYRLIGEKQKGYLYYRCHERECPQKTIREELIETPFKKVLKQMELNDFEKREFKKWQIDRMRNISENVEENRKALKLQLEQTQNRLSNLTDALADGYLEKEIYIEKKNSLVLAEHQLKNNLANVEHLGQKALEETAKYLELANSAYLSFKTASYTNKRELVKTVTSNFFINGKTVVIKPNLPFEVWINRHSVPYGGPHRDRPRTVMKTFMGLYKYFFKTFKSKYDLGLSERSHIKALDY